MKEIELQDYCDAGNSVLDSFGTDVLIRLGYKTKCTLNFCTLGDEITGLTYQFWVDVDMALLFHKNKESYFHRKLWANRKHMNECFPTIEAWINFLKTLIKTVIVSKSLT